MRLGNFESRAVSQGQLLSFVLADCGTLSDVPLPHPEPYQVLRPGDTISIDDGRLLGTVVDVTAKRIEIRMGRDGVIAPRKGFNRADHPVVMDDLSAKDIAVVETAYAAGCRCFALSFVATGHECAWVRRRAAEAEVIAKIERQDGLSRLNEIAQASDAVWICRGDLGAQLGLRALGRAISEIEPHKIASRLWMAGQVLEHLTAHGEPTRSEVCHLHDLLARGYVGIVLSDETAIGCDPVNAAYCARGLLDSFFDVPGDPGNNERLRENSMLGGCPRP
jgi:pyruvate kinase